MNTQFIVVEYMIIGEVYDGACTRDTEEPSDLESAIDRMIEYANKESTA